MFDSEEFKEFFSQFFAEFSKFMEEFQGKAHIYGDLWQFLLAKAAKELGILPQEEDRLLTPEETRQLYEKATSFMAQFPQKELAPSEGELKDDSLEKDLKPGKLPKPSWFNLEPPNEKKGE
ncbi:MAG: hypothetical protein ACPLPW_01520 [bacterium]